MQDLCIVGKSSNVENSKEQENIISESKDYINPSGMSEFIHFAILQLQNMFELKKIMFGNITS